MLKIFGESFGHLMVIFMNFKIVSKIIEDYFSPFHSQLSRIFLKRTIQNYKNFRMIENNHFNRERFNL